MLHLYMYIFFVYLYQKCWTSIATCVFEDFICFQLQSYSLSFVFSQCTTSSEQLIHDFTLTDDLSWLVSFVLFEINWLTDSLTDSLTDRILTGWPTAIPTTHLLYGGEHGSLFWLQNLLLVSLGELMTAVAAPHKHLAALSRHHVTTAIVAVLRDSRVTIFIRRHTCLGVVGRQLAYLRQGNGENGHRKGNYRKTVTCKSSR